MSRRIPIGILRQVVIALFGGNSSRAIAKNISGEVSFSAICKIKKKIKNSRFSEASLTEMSDQALSEFFYGKAPSGSYSPNEFHSQILSNLDYYQEELKRTGVDRTILWDELNAENPVSDSEEITGGSYPTFCRIIANTLGATKPTLSNARPDPASVLEIDFAGDKLYYTDRQTGKRVPCTVFVAILGFSLYSFVEILPDARTHYVLQALNNCLDYMGGTPLKLLTDNMAQLVKCADKYEPTFTDSAIQWANHYGIFLAATRSGRPRDKAGIERHVNIIYRRIHAVLRDRIFYSFEELKTAVRALLEAHNNKRLTGKQYSRRELFLKEEQIKLSSLPDKCFELQKVTRATVSKDCHVLLGEDKSRYSVPHKYIGKHLDILYTTKVVEIYDLFKWVASHSRNPERGSQTTDVEHLPANLKAQTEINSWTQEDYLKMAKPFGCNTVWLIEKIFSSHSHPSHAYRTCQGLLNLGSKRKFGPVRLENACHLALLLNKHSFKEVELLLKNERDLFYDALQKLKEKKKANNDKKDKEVDK